MITYNGYNPMYDVHKNMGEHFTWQNTSMPFSGMALSEPVLNPEPRGQSPNWNVFLGSLKHTVCE